MKGRPIAELEQIEMANKMRGKTIRESGKYETRSFLDALHQQLRREQIVAWCYQYREKTYVFVKLSSSHAVFMILA